ncbi:cupin domain-containing protein [Chloroflexota bacterium]
MLQFINPQEIAPFTPPGHENQSVRFLAKKENAKHLMVGLGQLDPGGMAELHRHETSEQFYYILKGRVVITEEGRNTTITEGTAVMIGVNELHGMINESGETVYYLAVTAPQMD